MSSRIDPNRPRELREDTPETNTNGGSPAAGAGRSHTPASAPILEHTRGSAALVSQRFRSSSTPIDAHPGAAEIKQKLFGSRVQPLPIDSYPDATRVSRALIPDTAAALPPQPRKARPNHAPSAPRAGGVPARKEERPLHVAAYEKYESIAKHHEAASRGLSAAETAWRDIAVQRRASEARLAPHERPAGVVGTAAEAERLADFARELRRTLNTELTAARELYELVTGTRSGAALSRSLGGSAAPARSDLERLQDRVARYNTSIALLKSSGVIGALVSTAKLAGAEINGKRLTQQDYAELDNLHRAAQVLNIVPSTMNVLNGPRGAAATAPGVDHRSVATRPSELPRSNGAEIRAYEGRAQQ